MDSDARVKAAKRLRARLEKARREMDEYGMVLTPEAERGYAMLIEMLRRAGAEDAPQEGTHRGQREI
jgi:hypothetical protein